jgi:hypothetical protein
VSGFPFFRHPREGGDPICFSAQLQENEISAFAEMTVVFDSV